MTSPTSRRLLRIVGGTIVAGAVLVLVVPQIVVAQIRRSHVEANVPAAPEFDADLARDLRAWFTQRQGSPTAVRFQLLRRGPTQTGVSYPKYYAWVEVQTGSAPPVHGAVRVAAVERGHFEVLQFLPADEIRTRPDAAESVFPAALMPELSRRAMQP